MEKRLNWKKAKLLIDVASEIAKEIFNEGGSTGTPKEFYTRVVDEYYEKLELERHKKNS